MNRTGHADFLGVTSALRHFHDHRLDPAYGGQYWCRLPNGVCVPMDKYEERLAAYYAERERTGQSGRPDTREHPASPTGRGYWL
ncbi:MAG: hypothetical protein AAGG50_04710 [Bacteroidota bacterium]